MRKPRLIEELETTFRVVRRRYVVDPPEPIETAGTEIAAAKPVLAKGAAASRPAPQLRLLKSA